MTSTGEPLSLPGPETGWPVDLTLGTVQVLGIDGRCAGAGFLVGDRLLVTCAHVLSSYRDDGEPPTDPVNVRFIPSLDNVVLATHVEPQLWRRPDAGDVAFLRLQDAPPARALTLGTSRGIRGHKVKAYGFAGNVPDAGAYGYGVAGDQIHDAGKMPLLQLTEANAITKGFSGSPVLDERTGLVVGMVSSFSATDPFGRGQDTAFVTPTEVLREICPELTVSQISPYRGLEPFTFVDAAWFHGRDRAVGAVLDSLRRDRRFLALLGPSGSGKSSLIHAGVLPALASGAIPGSDRWGRLSARPGADPFAQLELAGLPGVAAGLAVAAQRWLDEHPEHERLVLVLDQCEELLTTTPPSLRHALLDQLTAMVEQGPAVTVIVVFRSDFYGRLAAAAPVLMRLVERALVNVPALVEADELRAIITAPADLVGLNIEPGLVELIAEDAAASAPPPDGPGGAAAITVLPLLESALTELWRRSDDGRLTHHVYRRIGGVIGGLAGWCDEAYRALTSTQQPLARRIVTSLVRLGDEAANVPPTRQRRNLADLRSDKAGTPQGSDSDVNAVIAELTNRRLLITDHDPSSNESTVELVHDTLIHEWGQLKQWLEEDHNFLAWCHDLEADYKQWEASGQDPGRLLPGSALIHALHWCELRGYELSDKFTEFIRFSDYAEHKRRDRDRRRIHQLTILLLLVIGLGSFAGILAEQQLDQRNMALSRQLAANAQDQLTIDPERSLLLAREAHKIKPTPEAEAALRQATLDSQVRSMLHGHEGTVFGVAFSPDGKRVVSAGDDGTVRVWDAAGTGEPVVLRGPPGIYGVALSPDGKRVVSGGKDGTVRVWDTAGVGDPTVLHGHHDAVLSVAFSPDGKRVASAGEDRLVRVWDAAGTGAPVVLPGHQDRVYGVAFSPDGKRVVSAGDDGTVRIWDAAGTGAPVVLPGNQDVYCVAFSPDGRWVVSGGEDATVRVWDAAGTGIPIELSGHEAEVLGVAFSVDGKWIASASADGTVRVWDAAGAGHRVVLPGHQGKVHGVAFSPDGRQVVSGGKDATVRVWAAGTGDSLVLPGHQGKVYGVALSADGRRVASAGEDGTVRAWDVAGVGDPVVWRGHQGTVYGVAFSADGRRVASAGEDGTVRIWDVTGVDEALVLRGHQGQVLGVAFSADGRRVASAGGDTTVRVWDVTGVDDPVVLRGHEGTVYGVAFSPDGRRVASAGADTTVQVWDAAGTEDPVVLTGGHHGTAYGVAFSADGKWVASAGADTTVQVWDAASTGNPIVLRDRGAVRDVALSPDGKLVASANGDGLVRLWECEVCRDFAEVLKLAEQRSTRELTCREREIFRHEPCP